MADDRSYLIRLSKASPKQAKKLIAHAPPRIIRIIGNCAKVILEGKVLVTKKQKEALRPYKTSLRLLAKSPLAQKKKVLQKGGINMGNFLPTLLDLPRALKGVIKRSQGGRPVLPTVFDLGGTIGEVIGRHHARPTNRIAHATRWVK